MYLLKSPFHNKKQKKNKKKKLEIFPLMQLKLDVKDEKTVIIQMPALLSEEKSTFWEKLQDDLNANA